MPIKGCSSKGRRGFKYGRTGKCYTYKTGSKVASKTAKKKAIKQGLAIEFRRGGKFHG